MRNRWHLLISALALLFQLAPPIFIWAISTMAYAEPRHLPELWERPVSLLGLAFCAGASFLLGSIVVYGLLSRSRLRIAVVLIAVCCIPAMIGGVVYLQTWLVFLTLV